MKLSFECEECHHMNTVEVDVTPSSASLPVAEALEDGPLRGNSPPLPIAEPLD